MGQAASAKKAKADASKVAENVQTIAARASPNAADLQAALAAQQTPLASLGNSSRSFKFLLYNNSPYALSMNDFRLSSSCMWMTSPPGDLKPGEFGVFGAVTEVAIYDKERFVLSGQFAYNATLVGTHPDTAAPIPSVLQDLVIADAEAQSTVPKPAPGVLTSPPESSGRLQLSFSAPISSYKLRAKGSSLSIVYRPLKEHVDGHPALFIEIVESEVLAKRILSQVEINELVENTYFTPDEIIGLYEPFKKLAGEDEKITQTEFNAFLPELSDADLRLAVFSGFDKSQSFDCEVSFEEFVIGLSAACRGKLVDKATFVFNMFSTVGGAPFVKGGADGASVVAHTYVSKQHMLEVTSRISAAMQKIGFQTRDYGKPDQVVKNVFVKPAHVIGSTDSRVIHRYRTHRGPTPVFSPSPAATISTPASPAPVSSPSPSRDLDDGYHSDESHDTTDPKLKKTDSLPAASSRGSVTSVTPDNARLVRTGSNMPLEQEADTLELADFCTRCKNEPDLAACFGLFDFFNAAILEPIVKAILAKSDVSKQVGMVGWLMKNNNKRYFVLRGGFLGYALAPGQPLSRVIPLAEALIKPSSTQKNTFTLTVPYFERRLAAANEEEAKRWVNALRAHVHDNTRFRSFAPIRDNTHLAPFVNGKEYFDALVPVLQGAQKSIYISGWYLSPGVYLKRGSLDTLDKFRLDKLLLEAANRDVRIYVLIYGSMPLPEFDLGSDYVAQYLNNLHVNIYCIRHPNTTIPSMWTHHQKLVVVDEKVAFVGGLDLAYGRYDDSEYRVTDEDGIHFPGRDYFNSFWKGENNGPTKEPVIDRYMYTRMPWCDMQVQVTGLAAYDVSVNFIQRWVHAVREGTKELKPMPYIFPLQSLNDEGLPSKVFDAATGHLISAPASANDASVPAPSWDSLLPHATVKILHHGFPGIKAQIIRSISSWSGGVASPETSIYKAYLDLIEGAESFIYIQNQFFISSIEEASPKNRLLEALYARICSAIRTRQTFKVLVVLPTVPGGGPVSLGSTKFLLKHTYAAISRGGHSLMEKLKAEFPVVDVNQYISFATPRQIGQMGPYLMSEPVYVHAKVLIVDDKRAIVGSANINDRSFRGTRDSELACVFESGSPDSIKKITTATGKQVEVCTAVHDLRVRMWCDLLGIKASYSDYEQQLALIQDPISGLSHFMQRAEQNTKWYREIFPGKLPHDVLKAADFKLATNSVGDDVDAGTRHLRLSAFDNIRGLINTWPSDLMKDDPLEIGTFEKESVVPKIVFL